MNVQALGVLFLGCMGLLPSSVQAGEKASSPLEKPQGCSLSTGAFSERTTLVVTLLARQEAIKELEDGYAFRFPGDDRELATQLVELIVAERQCCSFLRFELSLAAEQGPIWLTVGGSQEAKALLTSFVAALQP